MEIHQILVSASPGDAVTSAALDLREVLRRIGTSEIFAHDVHEALDGEVGRLADYARRPDAATGDNLLVYHASIGEPAVCSFLLERRERLVLVYHDIIPPEYFADVDPAYAARLEEGRVDLAALRDRVALALAVSEFNGAELTALGYPDVRLSPLVVEPGRLLGAGPDPATAARLEEHLTGPLILFVGQLQPHKRPDLLLAAYHVLVTYLVPDAYLALVGPWPQPGYRDVVESFRLQLNLHRAWVAPRVSPAALATWFRAAAMFVTLSEHEGVCVPALEAMAFGVPVVARAGAALPETMAGAGLVLPPDDDPVLIAEAMAEVLGNDVLRKELVAAGQRRISALDPDRARATFLAHLADVV
jgi:glycosyltransferase involved in cell wall biosynthesis